MPLVDLKKYELGLKKYYIPSIITIERKRIIKALKFLKENNIDLSKEILNSFAPNKEYFVVLHVGDYLYSTEEPKGSRKYYETWKADLLQYFLHSQLILNLSHLLNL